MDEQRLNEIRARAEAATPAPWDVSEGNPNQFYICHNGYPFINITWWSESDQSVEARANRKNNALFTGHARQDVPDLLDEIVDMRKQLQAANERINELETAHLEGDGLGEDGAPRPMITATCEQLQAANERAAEAERHLRAVTRVEWMTVDDDGNLVTVCPWCRHSKAFGHRDCPRQAAAAWLEAGE